MSSTKLESLESLQIAQQLQSKNVLLIGAGKVATTRLPKILPTGCKLTVVSPEFNDTVSTKFPEFSTKKIIQVNSNWEQYSGQIYRVIRDKFQDKYLGVEHYWSLILVCIPDRTEAERIYNLCKMQYGEQQTVNVADVPELCDAFFGANLNLGHGDGLLQVMVSSNGLSPTYAGLVRNEIKTLFDDIDIHQSMINLGDLRQQIRELAPDPSDSKFRMQWIKECTGIFGLKECQFMNVPLLLILFNTMRSENSLKFPSRETMFTEYLNKPQDI